MTEQLSMCAQAGESIYLVDCCKNDINTCQDLRTVRCQSKSSMNFLVIIAIYRKL